MRFAYADPPYLGQGQRLYGEYHVDAADYDHPDTHRELVDRLCDEYPDGWALSLSSPSLHTILPMCPEDVRVGAWVKPFAVFKPGVQPGYCWEPVIYRGGRWAVMDFEERREYDTVRDFVIEPIRIKKGVKMLPGAKPVAFSRWVFDLLGARKGDTLDDLFPGTGAVKRAWNAYVECDQAVQTGLFADEEGAA